LRREAPGARRRGARAARCFGPGPGGRPRGAEAGSPRAREGAGDDRTQDALSTAGSPECRPQAGRRECRAPGPRSGTRSIEELVEPGGERDARSREAFQRYGEIRVLVILADLVAWSEGSVRARHAIRSPPRLQALIGPILDPPPGPTARAGPIGPRL